MSLRTCLTFGAIGTIAYKTRPRKRSLIEHVNDSLYKKNEPENSKPLTEFVLKTVDQLFPDEVFAYNDCIFFATGGVAAPDDYFKTVHITYLGAFGGWLEVNRRYE